MAVINKNKLLAGKELTKNIIINEDGDEIIIRTLTNKEMAKIKEVQTEGVKVNDKGQVIADGKIVSRNTANALNMVVLYGLVEPKLTLQEIEDMNPYDVEFIADKILKLTGLKPENSKVTGFPTTEDTKEVQDEVKSFRGND